MPNNSPKFKLVNPPIKARKADLDQLNIRIRLAEYSVEDLKGDLSNANSYLDYLIEQRERLVELLASQGES